MKLKNLLIEIRNNSNIDNWEITKDSESEFEAKTTIDGDTIVFGATRFDHYIHLFFESSEHGVERPEVNDPKKSLKTFSAVIAITRYYIKKYSPEKIFFSAVSNEGREGLYDKLADIIVDEGGYSLDKIVDNYEIEYNLELKGK